MIKAFVFDAYGTLYDTQSVTDLIGKAFPAQASYISPIWRLKQLEYSWLRALMDRYADFWTVTREALEYTLQTAGLSADPALFESVSDAYNKLAPYPDAAAALKRLSTYKCAILSNGSPEMLSKLVRHSGLDRALDAVISVDGKRVFKPHPRAYELIEETLGVKPHEVVFVSSNGFDVAGAKAFGLTVARIERLSPTGLSDALAAGGQNTPGGIFNALRSQLETCGAEPDYTIASLTELPALAARLAA